MKMRFEKQIARFIMRSGVLSSLEWLESRQPNVLRILGYHRIGHPDDESGKLDPSLLSTTPSAFAQQMRYLKENYHIVSVEELLHALDVNRRLPPQSVLITFDDGYRDFLDLAWPVLQELDIPAILFVATDYLSTRGRQSFWWDQLYDAITNTNCHELSLNNIGTWPLQNSEQRKQAFEYVKYFVKNLDHAKAMFLVDEVVEKLAVMPNLDCRILSWDEVRLLSKAGLYIGAHTRSHSLLSRISVEDARQEIVGSQDDIRRELNQTWPIFAYPSGQPSDLRPELNAILQEAGFQIAVTTIEGHNWFNHTDPLCFRRVNLAHHLSLTEFRLTLTGFYNMYGMLMRMRATR